MTEDIGRGIDAREAIEQDAGDNRDETGGAGLVAGTDGAAALIGQAVTTITQPAPGETVTIVAAAGQRYVIAFDPEAAQATVQGNDLILVFPGDARVVFQNLGTVANEADPPVFEIAGQPIASAALFNQAQALAEGTLETAAAPSAVQGTGATRYDDDTGQVIDLLDPLGVLPGVERLFPLIDLFPTIVEGGLNNPPVDFDVDVTANFFENLPFTFAPGLGSPVFTGNVGEDFLFVADEGTSNIFKISLDGKRISIAVSEDEIADAIGDSGFDLDESGVKVDGKGNIFFSTDNGDVEYVLVKLADTGEIKIVAEGSNDSDDLLFEFDPEDLVFGPDGTLFVLDDGNEDRIVRIDDPLGTPQISVVITRDQVEAQLEAALSTDGGEGGSVDLDIDFDVSLAISLDGKTIYIPVNDDIEGIVAVDVATGTASLLTPLENIFDDIDKFIALAPNGDIIVADEGNDEIYRVNKDTGEITLFLSRDDIAAANGGEFPDLEGGFAFDSAGNFYLAEEGDDNILMWPTLDSSSGEVVRGAGMILVLESQLEDVDGRGIDVDLEGGLTVGFAPLPADQFVVAYSGVREFDDYYGEVFTLVDTRQNGDGGLDIFARFVSPDGTPIGDEFQVNSPGFPGVTDLLPDVAALRGGGFVVTWTAVIGDLDGPALAALDGFDGLGGFGGFGGFGDFEGVVVLSRVFDGSGVPLGPEIPVTSLDNPNDGLQFISKAAGLNNGSFVITWTDVREPDDEFDGDPFDSIDIFARLFTPSGVPMGDEFQVNTLDGIQAISDVAALDDGGFAVVFTAIDTSFDGGEGGIDDQLDQVDVYVRVFDADCNPRGDEILITTVPDGLQALVKVTGLQGGGFLATWTDVNIDADSPESGINVMARVFDADGAPVAGEFLITSGPAEIEILSSAVALPGGKFFVSWTEFGSIDGGEGGSQDSVEIFGRVFGADGAPVGPEFQISDGQDFDAFSAIGILSTQAALGGTVLVTWTQIVDGDMAVFGRLYGVSGTASGDATPLGDPFQINEDTDPALLSSVAALQTSFQGGYLYEFQVGEAEIVQDNIHGTDIEDGVTTQFFITTLPSDQDGNPSGLLLVDRNDDNVIEEIYGEGFTPLPAGGIPVVTGDSVFYLLPSGSFEVKPDQVTFNYFTIDTDNLDSLNDGPATITIDFPDDEPKLVFVSDDASVDEDDIVVDGAEGGSQDPQEPGSDFLGGFLDDEFGASGDPLDPWPSDAPAVTGGTIFADLGMDRPGTITFSEANLAALEALGLTSSTHKDPDGDDLPLSYILGGDGRTLVGYVDVGDKDGVFDQVEGLEDASDDVVFVVTLAPTGSNTGEFTYTFKLFGSINHPVSTDGGEGVPNGMGENSIDLPFEFILSDIDGDDLTGTFNVEVVDDVPSIAANDFDHYGGSNPQPTDLVVQEETIDGGEGPAMAMTTATIVFGADGPEATQPGSDLYYGDAVSLALTGVKALADGPGDPSSDPDSPFVVPNGDGFTNLMSGGIPVQIRIEGPTRIVGFIEVQADNGGYEPSFVNGDVNGAHEEIVFEAFLDVSQGDLFGTDEAKFTYNLFRQLDHPDDAAVDGAEGGPGLGQTGGDDQIEFAFAVTVLDDDGDTATLDLTVRVDDDGPEIFRDTLAAVDEDGLAERDPPGDNQGIPDGPGDAPGEATMFTGNLDADFGADGPGDIDFAALDGQLVYDENGDQVFSRGEEVVYKWDAASHTLSAVVEGADSGAGGDGFLITWTQRDGFGQGDDVEVLGQILDLNGLPVGPEITVNSTQPDHQFNADAATLAGGRIVTVWQDTAASSPVINAQLFSESGTPLGGELTLSTLAASFAGDVTATPLAGGGFAVTWQDGDLFARTFDIDGNPTGAVIPVSVPADGNPSEVDVTALADGGLVLTWVNAETANPFDRETFARVLDADGNPRTGVFTVNADPVDFQLLPDVTALTGGGFVVAWDDRSLSPSDHDIVMRVFGADGAPVTGDIPVTGNSEDQTRPGVAALPGGGFAVSWADEDDSQDNIKIQFFDAAGAAQTGVDTVNTSGGAQFFPEIHALADGDVLVTWRGNGDSDDDGLFARVFAPDGTPVSGEIQINEDPAGSLIETDLEIVALPDGGFVASWVDGNQDGILGRVFDSSGNALTGDFSVNTTSNGFQFGPAGAAPIELASGEADRVIFEVEITDVATGAFKVTLLDQVDHPDETTEDNLIVDLEYAITDFDGDKQLGILKLDIDDDSPVIDGGEGGTAMSVQEEQIVDTADATVTYAFGADGPNDQTPIMIGLGSLEKVDEDGTEGGDMVLGGLTSDGRDVTIVNLDDVTIRGFVTLPGDSDVPEQDIFTATLDPVSGQFVFTLKGPIDHPDLGESGSDDQIRIQFDVTVKDFDGDTDTVVLSVTVDDDQPSLDDITLTHDETPGVDNPDDVDPATKSLGLQAALLGIFGEGAGFDGGEGNGESEGVPEELGVALNSLDFDYGADGPGRLIGLDPVVDGTDSGLFDTATGEAIYLYNGPDSTVVGVTFEDGIGDPEAIDLNAIRDSGGAVAFVAFMEPTSDASGLPDNASSADLWFVQYRAVKHDNPADHDEANPEPDGFDDEFLTLGFSVIDNDGDVVSRTATITVEDDGPTATDDVPVYFDGAEGGLADLDGAEGGLAGGNVLDNGDDPGVDGTVDGDPLAVISFTYTGEGELGDAVTITADAVSAGTTVTTFAGGELTVFADGEWEYEIGFGDDNSAAGYVDDFSYTIQDGDGDIDSATQPIRVALEPDVKILDGVGDIAGGADDDFLAGGDAANEISGLGGNDLLFGGGGDDTLIGGTGDDQMFGDDGDDMLNGDAGDDRLNGGTGDDDLTGDDGADIFGFTLTTHEGTDDITDFSTLEGDQLAFNDVVDLGSDGIDINDAVADFIPGDGAGAVDMIVLTSGTTINVTDVDDSLDDINDVFANSIINGA